MNDPVLMPRWMTAADWPAVEAGFAHSFRDCRAGPVWDWRYRRADPAAWCGVVAPAPDGGIAAFVAGTRQRAWVRGRAATVVVCGDNYTAPAWRSAASGRNGLFARAAHLFFDAQPDDVAACVGVANARRVRLTERLGINRTCATAQWHLWTPTPEASHGLSCLVQACDFAAAGAEWDRLWEARQAVQRAGLVRDRAFLSWRFDARHGREYWRFALRSVFAPDALGYLVLTPYGADGAVLVDAVLPPQLQVARDAWGQIAAWLARRGVGRVWTLASVACPEAILLPAMGFRPAAAPLASLPAFAAYPAWLDTAAFERDYAYTLADSDLF